MKKFILGLLLVFSLVSCNTDDNEEPVDNNKHIPVELKTIDLDLFTNTTIYELDTSVTDSISYSVSVLDSNTFDQDVKDVIELLETQNFVFGPILGENPIMKIVFENENTMLTVSFYNHTENPELKAVSFELVSEDTFYYILFQGYFEDQLITIYNKLN